MESATEIHLPDSFARQVYNFVLKIISVVLLAISTAK